MKPLFVDELTEIHAQSGKFRVNVIFFILIFFIRLLEYHNKYECSLSKKI